MGKKKWISGSKSSWLFEICQSDDVVDLGSLLNKGGVKSTTPPTLPSAQLTDTLQLHKDNCQALIELQATEKRERERRRDLLRLQTAYLTLYMNTESSASAYALSSAYLTVHQERLCGGTNELDNPPLNITGRPLFYFKHWTCLPAWGWV